MAQTTSVRLQRSDASPWGFRLQGGKDFGSPLTVQKVNGGSAAERAGLQAGDAVLKVNGTETADLRHKEAQDCIQKAGDNVELFVQRGGSAWRPAVAPVGAIPTAPAPRGAVFTNTSLAATPAAARAPSATNFSPAPFGGAPGAVNGGVRPYNSPVGLYSEENIAETLSAQAEVLSSGVLGVNFKKNERHYDPGQSEVFKMLHEADNQEAEPGTPVVCAEPRAQPVAAAPSAYAAPAAKPAGAGAQGGSGTSAQSVCAECERLVVGVFVRIKDRSLHVECFKCATCGSSLKNVGYFCVNNKLYCDVHAKLVARQRPPAAGLVPVTMMPPSAAIGAALAKTTLNQSSSFSSVKSSTSTSQFNSSSSQFNAPAAPYSAPAAPYSAPAAPYSAPAAPYAAPAAPYAAPAAPYAAQAAPYSAPAAPYAAPAAPYAAPAAPYAAPAAPFATPSAQSKPFAAFNAPSGQFSAPTSKVNAPGTQYNNSAPQKPFSAPSAPQKPFSAPQAAPSKPFTQFTAPPAPLKPGGCAPLRSVSNIRGGGPTGGPKGASFAGSSAPVRGRGVLNQAVGAGGRIPLCASCNGHIRGPFVTALGKIWCPEHFVCARAQCGRQLADIGFVEEGGQLHCEFCFEQFLAPPCAKCNGKVKGDCLNAVGKQYHPECFVCAYCGKLFGNDPFFLEDGLPYCQADWNELFTTKCFACGFPIEAGDRWVEALNNNYHSQCFNCTSCKKNLEGQSFFAKSGRPFCKAHAR